MVHCVTSPGMPVGAVVSAKVVPEHAAKLFPVVDVGAGGHEVAAGQPLVKGGVVPPVQLVNRHLPDVVRSKHEGGLYDKLGQEGGKSSFGFEMVWWPTR